MLAIYSRCKTVIDIRWLICSIEDSYIISCMHMIGNESIGYIWAIEKSASCAILANHITDSGIDDCSMSWFESIFFRENWLFESKVFFFFIYFILDAVVLIGQIVACNAFTTSDQITAKPNIWGILNILGVEYVKRVSSKRCSKNILTILNYLSWIKNVGTVTIYWIAIKNIFYIESDTNTQICILCSIGGVSKLCIMILEVMHNKCSGYVVSELFELWKERLSRNEVL
jgi:hypothetical protein